MKRAAFLDRDGTLIDDPGYLGDPAQVELLPGVAAALRQLAELGVLRVVITNQSGIGRGMLTEAQVHAVHDEIDRQLASVGASIDAWHFCPHPPDARCDCRKPGTALHRAAAAHFGIEPEHSWCIGDRISDVTAVGDLGGRAILVRTGDGAKHAEAAIAAGIPVVSDLAAAADFIRVAGAP